MAKRKTKDTQADRSGFQVATAVVALVLAAALGCYFRQQAGDGVDSVWEQQASLSSLSSSSPVAGVPSGPPPPPLADMERRLLEATADIRAYAAAPFVADPAPSAADLDAFDAGANQNFLIKGRSFAVRLGS